MGARMLATALKSCSTETSWGLEQTK